jgi:hypothetical protein
MLTADEVTIAALANMVRLLCAELVAGQHRDDINLVESAVRSKLNVAISGATPETLVAGLKRAHEVLTPVLAGVRAQAAVALEHDAARAAQNAGTKSPNGGSISPELSVKGSRLN